MADINALGEKITVRFELSNECESLVAHAVSFYTVIKRHEAHHDQQASICVLVCMWKRCWRQRQLRRKRHRQRRRRWWWLFWKPILLYCAEIMCARHIHRQKETDKWALTMSENGQNNRKNKGLWSKINCQSTHLPHLMDEVWRTRFILNNFVDSFQFFTCHFSRYGIRCSHSVRDMRRVRASVVALPWQC